MLAFLWGNIPHGATEQLSPYLTSVLTPERAARREKQRESLFKEVGESLAGSSKAGKRDAYVTLVANDEFLLPGMVLGYSLRDFLSGFVTNISDLTKKSNKPILTKHSFFPSSDPRNLTLFVLPQANFLLKGNPSLNKLGGKFLLWTFLKTHSLTLIQV